MTTTRFPSKTKYSDPKYLDLWLYHPFLTQVVSLNVDKVTGVISLSDILNFLVLRPGGDDPSQPGCTDMFSKVQYMLQIFQQRDHIICPSWFVFFLLYVRVRSAGIFEGSDHFRFSLL